MNKKNLNKGLSLFGLSNPSFMDDYIKSLRYEGVDDYELAGRLELLKNFAVNLRLAKLANFYEDGVPKEAGYEKLLGGMLSMFLLGGLLGMGIGAYLEDEVELKTSSAINWGLIMGTMGAGLSTLIYFLGGYEDIEIPSARKLPQQQPQSQSQSQLQPQSQSQSQSQTQQQPQSQSQSQLQPQSQSQSQSQTQQQPQSQSQSQLQPQSQSQSQSQTQQQPQSQTQQQTQSQTQQQTQQQEGSVVESENISEQSTGVGEDDYEPSTLAFTAAGSLWGGTGLYLAYNVHRLLGWLSRFSNKNYPKEKFVYDLVYKGLKGSLISSNLHLFFPDRNINELETSSIIINTNTPIGEDLRNYYEQVIFNKINFVDTNLRNIFNNLQDQHKPAFIRFIIYNLKESIDNDGLLKIINEGLDSFNNDRLSEEERFDRLSKMFNLLFADNLVIAAKNRSTSHRDVGFVIRMTPKEFLNLLIKDPYLINANRKSTLFILRDFIIHAEKLNYKDKPNELAGAISLLVELYKSNNRTMLNKNLIDELFLRKDFDKKFRDFSERIKNISKDRGLKDQSLSEFYDRLTPYIELLLTLNRLQNKDVVDRPGVFDSFSRMFRSVIIKFYFGERSTQAEKIYEQIKSEISPFRTVSSPETIYVSEEKLYKVPREYMSLTDVDESNVVELERQKKPLEIHENLRSFSENLKETTTRKLNMRQRAARELKIFGVSAAAAAAGSLIFKYIKDLYLKDPNKNVPKPNK